MVRPRRRPLIGPDLLPELCREEVSEKQRGDRPNRDADVLRGTSLFDNLPDPDFRQSDGSLG